MNKQQLLNSLLEAQTKCKNFHFACYSLTLTKEEIDYFVGLMSKEIKSKGKYTLIIYKDKTQINKIEHITKEFAQDYMFQLKGELDKLWNWHYEIKEKHKIINMYIFTKKEHPYGDY